MLLLIFENLPPWPVEIDHRCIDFDDDFSQYVTNSAWIGQAAGGGDRGGTRLFHSKFNKRLVPMRYTKGISRRRSKLSVLECELGMISRMISRMIL